MTLEELETIVENSGVKVIYKPNLDRLGGYSKQTQTIYMPTDYQSMPTNAVSVLAHEYAHHMLGHDGPQPQAEEQRADRLAASIIVSPTEYALAEKLHRDNVPAIADELGVTSWIVVAYQQYLSLM